MVSKTKNNHIFRLLFFVIGLFLIVQCQNKLSQSTPPKKVFEDGTYTGSVKDWPSMEVEIKIIKGTLSEIKILDSDGTESILEEVKHKLIPFMVEKGTYDVEGISGATLSSNHLKLAIKHALAMQE